jgi:hypothetical protein
MTTEVEHEGQVHIASTMYLTEGKIPQALKFG